MTSKESGSLVEQYSYNGAGRVTEVARSDGSSANPVSYKDPSGHFYSLADLCVTQSISIPNQAVYYKSMFRNLDYMATSALADMVPTVDKKSATARLLDRMISDLSVVLAKGAIDTALSVSFDPGSTDGNVLLAINELVFGIDSGAVGLTISTAVSLSNIITGSVIKWVGSYETGRGGHSYTGDITRGVANNGAAAVANTLSTAVSVYDALMEADSAMIKVKAVATSIGKEIDMVTTHALIQNIASDGANGWFVESI
jgi:YD repeat-containing protein